MKDPIPSDLKLVRGDTIDYNLARNYTGLTYILNQASVNFTEQYGMNWVKGQNDTIYSHLNIDALSLWYQISAKPDFYKIFEAMLKVRSQFVEEFFLRVVSYNAYHYIFKNKLTVIESVLGFIDPADAEDIYQDQFLGMDSPSKLLYWFQALQGG